MSATPSAGYTQLGRYQEYVTGELRALTLPSYHDPLFVCFKVVFDYTKPYGLLADESNTDSALAYLKRIGDDTRYTMLKQWIAVWKNFWSDYDFLIQQVDGLNIIENAKPQDAFVESEKITFQIRETADMLFTSLLATYRHIWHDDIRVVEVLPANLRRFDFSVIVYNNGYYNMSVYDNPDGNVNTDNIPLDQIEQVVFPTLRKLSDAQFSLDGTAKQFNHVLYKIQDASIVTEESSSQFSSTFSNENSGTMLMQNLVLQFRFGSYSGRFNNIMGNIDFTGILAMMAAQNKAASLGAKTQAIQQSFISQMANSFKNQAIDKFKQSEAIIKNVLTSNNQFLGNLINNLNEQSAANMLNNLFADGLNYAQTVLVVNPLARVENLIMNNFNSLVNSVFGPTSQQVGLFPKQVIPDAPAGVPYVAASNGAILKGSLYGEYIVAQQSGLIGKAVSFAEYKVQQAASQAIKGATLGEYVITQRKGF